MAVTRLAETALDAIQVEVDGHPVTSTAALVTVANVETYRGFLSLTPAASPVDGLLDVCVIPGTTKTGVLAQLIKLMLALPGCRDEVGLYRGRHIRVSVNRRKPEDVRVLGGVLPVLAPAGSLERLKVRQAAAEAEAVVVTPAPQEQAGLVRATRSTSTPSPIHTTCLSRLRRLKASPACAPNPSAAKAAAFAPSSAPRLPGMKKVAKRTAEPSVSITTAVASDAGT